MVFDGASDHLTTHRTKSTGRVRGGGVFFASRLGTRRATLQFDGLDTETNGRIRAIAVVREACAPSGVARPQLS
jgi:hypothetical protein